MDRISRKNMRLRMRLINVTDDEDDTEELKEDPADKSKNVGVPDVPESFLMSTPPRAAAAAADPATSWTKISRTEKDWEQDWNHAAKPSPPESRGFAQDQSAPVPDRWSKSAWAHEPCHAGAHV